VSAAEQIKILNLEKHVPETQSRPEWTRSEIEAQVGRILQSPPFRNTAVLQAFLRFITERSIEGDTTGLTEHSIAAEVFSRGSTFDSSADTIVRTQAYRLRLKLREYYSNEGKNDPILIAVPKGHYVPSFLRNSQSVEEEAPEIGKVGKTAPPLRTWQSSSLLSRSSARAAALALLFAAIFGLGVFAGKVTPKSKTDLTGQNTLNDVDSFWSNFAGPDRQPIIAYTNSIYLATETGDLLRFRSGPVADRGALVNPQVAQQGAANRALLKVSGPTYFEDDLTGIGEVMEAVAVTEALRRVGAHPSYKRSKQISTQDLSNHNAVFLGSPFVNQILNDLPRPQNFVFTPPFSRPLLWTARIVNTHPQPGEAAAYAIERAPGTQVIRTDYGVVALLPGLMPNRKILILAGLTTSGTQAAAQFAASLPGVKEMKRRLLGKQNSDGAKWPLSFEYLLRTRLNQGVDIVQSECLASRFSNQE